MPGLLSLRMRDMDLTISNLACLCVACVADEGQLGMCERFECRPIGIALS